MSKLIDFLTKLGADADYAAQYEKDPAATMTAAGLTAEEQQLVLSGDVESIKQAAGLSSSQWSAMNIKAYAMNIKSYR